jgi:hypothetical protein
MFHRLGKQPLGNGDASDWSYYAGTRHPIRCGLLPSSPSRVSKRQVRCFFVEEVACIPMEKVSNLPKYGTNAICQTRDIRDTRASHAPMGVRITAVSHGRCVCDSRTRRWRVPGVVWWLVVQLGRADSRISSRNGNLLPEDGQLLCFAESKPTQTPHPMDLLDATHPTAERTPPSDTAGASLEPSETVSSLGHVLTTVSSRPDADIGHTDPVNEPLCPRPFHLLSSCKLVFCWSLRSLRKPQVGRRKPGRQDQGRADNHTTQLA